MRKSSGEDWPRTSARRPDPFFVDVVVDRDGKIVYVAREYDPDGIRGAIDALLGR
jgi:hypothetical protein